MGTRLPILLPYGLSSEHNSFVRGDANIPKQHGPLRFRIASLSELLAPSRLHAQTLPPLAASITASAAIGARKNHQRIDMAPEKGQKKHRRSKKRLKPSKKGSASGRDIRNAFTMGADPRLGASHDMPITLDSESSESVASVSSCFRLRSNRGVTSNPVRPATAVPDLEQSRKQHQNLSAWSRQRSRSVTPFQDSYVSSGFTLRSSQPAHTLHSPRKSSSSESETPLFHESTARRRESACTMPHATTGNAHKTLSNISRHRHGTDQSGSAFKTPNSRPTNMRDGKGLGTFSQTKAKTPGPWQYRHLQTKSESRRGFPTILPELNTPLSQELGKTSEVTDDNQTDMALLDIDDFELRSKVAQLMAVAPALPVRDLYHLVIDSAGCMAQAKKRARTMSEAPCASPTFAQSTFVRSRKIVEDDDNDDDDNVEEVKVKIDPSNPTFEWDDDEPALGPTSTLKARPSNSNLRNNITDCSRSLLSTRSKNRTNTSELSSRSGTKRSKVSSSKRASTRETSSDRDFIVADNVIEYVLDSDESHEFDIPFYSAGKTRGLLRRKYSMI